MNVNSKKTKEMVFGSFSKESTTPLLISTKPVERVSEYKLLGVTVNAMLKWDDHISTVTSKAAKRLWFLKKLKRAGVTRDDLLYFYQAVVRPVLEYASPAWHTSLTKQQTKSLEDIQRRALQIILGNMSYEDACCSLNIDSLADRRLELCKKLFRQIVCESHNLHYLLPTKRDCQVTNRLRSSNKYPVVRARTDRCKRSFIMHSLANFQGR